MKGVGCEVSFGGWDPLGKQLLWYGFKGRVRGVIFQVSGIGLALWSRLQQVTKPARRLMLPHRSVVSVWV